MELVGLELKSLNFGLRRNSTRLHLGPAEQVWEVLQRRGEMSPCSPEEKKIRKDLFVFFLSPSYFI